jgi:UDP-N-acetyl-D-mannosaminuronic acid dehydrogenase
VEAVVVALGKVGLPLAVAAARAGHRVTGCDIDPDVVASVAAGRPPFPGEAGLEEALAEVIRDGRLTASTDTTAAVAAGADLVLVVPPLLVDGEGHPDWRALDAAIDDVGAGLQRGTTVSLETTVPVGSTRRRLAPRLEERSGLVAERDFHVVFSPERVYSGRVLADLDSYPKLVGGLSPEGEDRAAELYGAFLSTEVRRMGSAEAAEMTKLVEATYRDVNIALANEFARFADVAGIDVAAVIAAANSQPFSHVHSPGVAVGGHCTPVYPRFYIAGDPESHLPAAARAVNESMPAYAVDLLARALDGGLDGQRVLILGVSYRGGVKETAFSGAHGLRDELTRRGAVPVAADPLFTAAELAAEGFAPWDGDSVGGAILQADHEEYRRLTPADLPGVRAVVDGRDVLERAPFDAAGIPVARIGRP